MTIFFIVNDQNQRLLTDIIILNKKGYAIKSWQNNGTSIIHTMREFLIHTKKKKIQHFFQQQHTIKDTQKKSFFFFFGFYIILLSYCLETQKKKMKKRIRQKKKTHFRNQLWDLKNINQRWVINSKWHMRSWIFLFLLFKFHYYRLLAAVSLCALK